MEFSELSISSVHVPFLCLHMNEHLHSFITNTIYTILGSIAPCMYTCTYTDVYILATSPGLFPALAWNIENLGMDLGTRLCMCVRMYLIDVV